LAKRRFPAPLPIQVFGPKEKRKTIREKKRQEEKGLFDAELLFTAKKIWRVQSTPQKLNCFAGGKKHVPATSGGRRGLFEPGEKKLLQIPKATRLRGIKARNKDGCFT